ncbi:MAG: hypothetical protein LDL19_00800 [Thiobacillus sp.]|nr:hypothetical protein [Thiobacillus sp.]
MKASQYKFAVSLFGCMALLVAHSSRADSDLENCKAGYQVLLMTPGECRTYLNDLRAAQALADYGKVLELQEWHAELLIERSQACPCRPNKADMRQVHAADTPAPAQVANSLPQP